MRFFARQLRTHTFRRALFLFALVLAGTAAGAAAIDSEGELVERDRLVGNLGVAHADLGVYPDRAGNNPAPERSGGTTTISVPAGSEIVQSLVYWAGRGPGWEDPNIEVNGTSIDADIDYRWETPSYDQSTYVTDISDAGVIGDGTTTLTISGADQNGERFYGIGFLVIYENPALPEVEMQLLEGNEFAFFDDTFFDEIGEAAVHTSVNCTQFSPSIEDRDLLTFSRIMGVDAGRGDGPPRTQRLQWWTGTTAIATPIADGLVQIPTQTPSGSVDNPVATKVPATGEWGSDTFEAPATLAAGDTHHCNQLQSVSIGDGAGASLSLTNQGAAAETVHRLGNLVWFDLDDDGMAEVGEPGIDGVTVQLFREGEDEPLATTITADDGSYAFEGLLCGSYRVEIPADQAVWTVDGVEVDPADFAAGSVNNPDANSDDDNDNNGVADGAVISSGLVQIGDCGEDGDFSNDASNEPTGELVRKDGTERADSADDPFEDVRSNVSVDIGLTGDLPVEVCDAAGNVVVDGEEGVDGAAAANCGDDTEVCDAAGNVVVDGEEGVNGAAAANCDPAGLIDPIENGVVCDEAGNIVADGEEGVNGAAAANCGDDTEVCDAAGNIVADGEEGVNGAAAANCGDDEVVTVVVGGTVECPAGSARAGENVQPGESCDEVTTEVQGQVETNDPGALAITGVTSRVFVLSALIVLVLGMWFTVASAWFRPTRRNW